MGPTIDAAFVETAFDRVAGSGPSYDVGMIGQFDERGSQ